MESSDGLEWTQAEDERPFEPGASVKYRMMDYGTPKAAMFNLPRAALARVSGLSKSCLTYARRPDGSVFECRCREKVDFSHGNVDDNAHYTDDFHIVDFDGWVYASISWNASKAATTNHAANLMVFPSPQEAGSVRYTVTYSGVNSAQRHAYLWLPVKKGYGVRLSFTSAVMSAINAYCLYPNRA